MTDLLYGSNPGCVAATAGFTGTPHQCGAPEAAAVPHRYRYPRPHATRLYVCARHAEGREDAEPLTDEDRAVVAERRERRRVLLERAGR